MDVREAARRWLAEDPDPDTREELERLLDLDDVPGLEDRFRSALRFGTAGLRGTLGAGPNRMNRAVVRRVTAGLAARLNEAAGGAGARGVVVGRDARHKSDAFAGDAARVLAGAGIGVWRYAEPVPTPLVAFTVRGLGAAGGVQITASHNPPTDNGYKVYGPGGALITEPFDREVAEAVDAIPSLDDVPLAAEDDALLWDVDPVIEDEYLDEVAALAGAFGAPLRIVYTPLHGVAARHAVAALRRGGFDDVHVVPEQAEPDPDFPTVAFPNPEEPGALDLALALAREVGADLVLANDPDGDRIAVAIPVDGTWRALSGDEVGCLLGAAALDAATGPCTVGTTVVSSQLLGRMAADAGARYVETLTGFKWLAEAAAEAAAAGAPMALAYEQALGVSVGDVVRDKDGIGAAVAVAGLASRANAAGGSLSATLEQLARRFGLHHTRGRNVRLDPAGGAALVRAALERLRTAAPETLGGARVTWVADHAQGVVRHADGRTEEIALPAANLVRLQLDDGSRVMVRPSGTEPLLKFYAEVVEPAPRGEPLADTRTRAAARVESLLDELVGVALPDA